MNLPEPDTLQGLVYVLKFYAHLFIYILAIITCIIVAESVASREPPISTVNQKEEVRYTLKGKSLSREEWQNLEWQVPDNQNEEDVDIDQILLLLDSSSPGP